MAEDRVERLAADSHNFIREKMAVFCGHWKEMYGLDSALIDRYCSTVQYNLEHMFSDIQSQVENKKSKMIEEVENKLQEHDQLQKELNLRIDQQYSNDQPLAEIIKSLDNQLEQYRALRAERIQMLVTLQEKERELCEFLAESPYHIQVTVPSDAELADIQQHVHHLQNVKIERRSTFLDLKLKIRHLMDILEIGPGTEFEKNAMSNDDDTFRLTSLNLRKLEDVLRKYDQMIRDKEEQIQLLKSKVETLWSRISVDDTYKINFMAHCNGIGQSTTSMILKEIDRCEEIKRANIKPYIETIRRDIANIWEMLTFSEAERNQFSAYYTDSFNEDVLELHEMEHARLNQLYYSCKGILELAEQRKLLWDRMKHLQEQATNPSRLKNRGGQLLREEKERKSLEKSLPKIESQLKKALVTYYEQHGRPFLWYGQDLLQMITVECAIEKTLLNTRTNSSKVSTPRGTPRATPSRGNSRHGSVSNLLVPHDVEEASVASYSQFQEQMELGTYLPTPSKRYTPQPSNAKKFLTPVTRSATRSVTRCATSSTSRLPLRQIQPSPYHYRAHSSPTTPKRTIAFKPKPSPRRITPRRYGFSATKNSFQF